MTGELIGYLKKLAKIHGHPEYYVECLIVEASDKLLSSTNPWIQKKAQKRLSSLGVKFKFNSMISAVQDHEIVFQDKSTLPYDVLIWTAGVKANNIANILSGVKLEKASCLAVDDYLKILPYDNVFGVGDIIYCLDHKTTKPLPMTAMVALREAKYVAENIKRSIVKKRLKKYKSHSVGFVIPLGGKYALLESHGFKLAGIIPWALKHLISLHYWAGLLGWAKSFGFWRKGLEIYAKND